VSDGDCDDDAVSVGVLDRDCDDDAVYEGVCDGDVVSDGDCDDDAVSEGVCDDDGVSEGVCDDEGVSDGVCDDEGVSEGVMVAAVGVTTHPPSTAAAATATIPIHHPRHPRRLRAPPCRRSRPCRMLRRPVLDGISGRQRSHCAMTPHRTAAVQVVSPMYYFQHRRDPLNQFVIRLISVMLPCPATDVFVWRGGTGGGPPVRGERCSGTGSVTAPIVCRSYSQFAQPPQQLLNCNCHTCCCHDN